MKPSTPVDVLMLLGSYVDAAALGVALELGLFWRLAERPESAASLAQALDTPANRCVSWLEVLADLGLLDRRDGGYVASPAARAAILDAYSSETWALLAQEAREAYPAGRDLARHIGDRGSVWSAQGLTPPDYIAQMTASPERARRFTRMLFELHQGLAEEVAAALDMTGVRRLMDLGGGSGVVSRALLRRHPDLTAVLVDIPNVCAAAREIPADPAIAERMAYASVDLLQDRLPAGFDVVLECDVGIYTAALFGKVRAALRPGGRLVIIEELSQPDCPPSARQLRHVLWATLRDPDSTLPSVADVERRLGEAGFRQVSRRMLSGTWMLVEAR